MAYTEYTIVQGINDLVRYLKNNPTGRWGDTDVYGTPPTPSNVWNKLTEAYLLSCVNFDGLAVKLKGSGLMTIHNFSAADLSPVGVGAGLTGDGATKYADTGLALVPAETNSLSAYVTGANTDATSALYIASMTSGGPDGAGLGRLQSGSGDAYTSGLNSGAYALETVTSRDGFFAGTRRSATDRELYRNGSSIGTNTNDHTPTTTEEFFIFALNDAGSEGVLSDATLAFAHIGTGLTDAEAAYLSWCVNAWATSFGSNTYVNS